MANNFKETGAARIAKLNALTALLNAGGAGSIKIYTGAQPTSPDDAATGTLLATLPLSATSFPTAAADASDPKVVTATANAITSAAAAATGTAGYFRAVNNAGTAIADGSVGTSGCDLNLNTTSLVSGGTVSITSWVITAP